MPPAATPLRRRHKRAMPPIDDFYADFIAAAIATASPMRLHTFMQRCADMPIGVMPRLSPFYVRERRACHPPPPLMRVMRAERR